MRGAPARTGGIRGAGRPTRPPEDRTAGPTRKDPGRG